MLRKTAHKKMINCINVTDVIRHRVVIITAGEDENIKLWDTSFNKLGEINLRGLITSVEDISQSRNLSAQSIDIFACPLTKETEGMKSKEDEMTFIERTTTPY